MKMQSIEYQVLLAASDIDPGDRQREKLLGLVARDFDQELLVDMALREGVAGLLYKNLKKTGVLGYLGHQQIKHLQSAYFLTFQFNLSLIHNLKKILRRLNKKNIRVVLLQGIPLLQQIYKDIGLRPLTDIDLWVLPDIRNSVDDELTALGFKNDRLYPNTFRKDSMIVDINTQLLWADRIKSRQLLINDIQEQLFHDCRQIDFEGEKAYCLSRPDQILYLSMHVIKHYADRLIWLVDLKNLLRDWQTSDWQLLFSRSRELGQGNFIHYIMFVLGNLFDCKSPSNEQAGLRAQRLNRLERLVLQKRLNGNSLPAWSPLLFFTAGKGFRRKAVFVLESLFPRPEVLRQVFANTPDLKVWQLYLKRALQLVAQVKL